MPLKLKRKLAYCGHYMYDYVIPQKAMNALMFLKWHNPLYANVEVIEHCFDQALSNNEELSKSLVKPNEEMDIEPLQVSNCTNVLTEALQKLQTVVSLSGFVIHPVPSDGNCMFSAVSISCRIPV